MLCELLKQIKGMLLPELCYHWTVFKMWILELSNNVLVIQMNTQWMWTITGYLVIHRNDKKKKKVNYFPLSKKKCPLPTSSVT